MNDHDRRAATEVWDEIVRTAALIQGYNPMLEEYERRLLEDRVTAADAKGLSEVVSDALILVGLIVELDQGRALAFGERGWANVAAPSNVSQGRPASPGPSLARLA